ncbi:MAG TPA: NifU family protein [Gemmatimonadaceae bacterium]|nr:NifU family protein [Gemmatimonadaceae bacterium]
MEDRIRKAIDGLVPILRIDACHIQLAGFERDTGRAILRIEGGCEECDMSVLTLLQGIEAHLRLHVPEIREVRALSDDHESDA